MAADPATVEEAVQKLTSRLGWALMNSTSRRVCPMDFFMTEAGRGEAGRRRPDAFDATLGFWKSCLAYIQVKIVT